MPLVDEPRMVLRHDLADDRDEAPRAVALAEHHGGIDVIAPVRPDLRASLGRGALVQREPVPVVLIALGEQVAAVGACHAPLLVVDREDEVLVELRPVAHATASEPWTAVAADARRASRISSRRASVASRSASPVASSTTTP